MKSLYCANRYLSHLSQCVCIKWSYDHHISLLAKLNVQHGIASLIPTFPFTLIIHYGYVSWQIRFEEKMFCSVSDYYRYDLENQAKVIVFIIVLIFVFIINLILKKRSRTYLPHQIL